MPRFVASRFGLLLSGSLLVSFGGPGSLAQSAPPSKPFKIVDRLKVDLPPKAALGTPFYVVIKFPKDGVLGVAVRQFDEVGHSDDIGWMHHGNEKAPIAVSSRGETVALVTPLLMGKVHFTVNAVFADGGASGEDFDVKVGPPTSPPQNIRGDQDFIGGDGRFAIGIGNTFKLRPVAFFDSAPGHEFHVQGLATYRLLPSEGPPVATLAADGTVSALRPGTAMAEVSFAGATSQFSIVVPRF